MLLFSVPIILVLITSPIASGHTNIGYPKPYNKWACDQSRSWCFNAPCPPIYKTGPNAAINSPKNPSAVWKRGQEVSIVWHKNNHNGGFYRRSLVPVNKMFDHKWHKLTAFDYGCWSQGKFQCNNCPLQKHHKKCSYSWYCGGDKTGKAYKNKVVIPPVFPGKFIIHAKTEAKNMFY